MENRKVCRCQCNDIQAFLNVIGILKLLGVSVNIKWTVMLLLERTEKCQCDSLNLNFKNNFVSLILMKMFINLSVVVLVLIF